MTILYQFVAPLTQLVDAWMDKSAPIREMLVLNAVCKFVNVSNQVAHCTLSLAVLLLILSKMYLLLQWLAMQTMHVRIRKFATTLEHVVGFC